VLRLIWHVDKLKVILPRAITFKPEGEGYRNFREEWRKYYEANSFKVLRLEETEERGKYYEANSCKAPRPEFSFLFILSHLSL